jgi:ribosomal protein L16 Arg81 hydroxylase
MIDFGISAETFIAEYYERQFWLCKGALTSCPVNWSDINTALFAWNPSDGLLQIFKDGLIPIERYTENFADLSMQRTRIVKDVFYDFMREGATLVLNRLETKSEPVHDLVMEVARFIGEKAVANGYAAFGGEGTFAKHWDTHDVFAIQLIGRKRWRVYAPTFALPLPQQRSREHKQECPTEPMFDGILEAGDVLYIPRGWWHEAIPLPDEETFHIAVGIHPMFLRDYIAWSCFKTFPSDVALRKSIKAECNDTTELSDAAKVAQAFLVDEVNLTSYKREIFSNERVISRFSLETLGRPGGAVAITGQFRLNSVYRTTALSSTKVHVNGQAISVDKASEEHLRALFSQTQTTTASIPKSVAQRNQVNSLLQQLVARDVVSPVPNVSAASYSRRISATRNISMPINQLKALPLMAIAILCIAYANSTEAQSKNNLESFKNAAHYTRGLAGFAGHQFEADAIFENILTTKNAENIFLETISSPNSSPASIAYAFCGLKKLNSKGLLEIKKILSSNNTEVSLMHGDVMKKEVLSKLTNSIYNHGC